ncbi:DJ-1/PfpI family protein [Vibrio sp. 99-70-13A1]|uniref:DJ-1/PfpI family protein n=1 Tax=Vibrio sp. 99-70-13A1 TaxID=2607601 RepID=UPI0014937D4B|nr:DJ-1/PfpI family protein [Vibrio sp. 99-70-13A1]NOH98978.1 DJ-1/PfpI family protein [Vibrio sp. 99-70-13A1]
MKKKKIGIFLYPNMTMLDAYAPLQFLALTAGIEVFTFAKLNQPVPTDAGVDIIPNYSFESCPSMDVLMVPGGSNPLEQMKDEQVISFLVSLSNDIEYITSVCTGSLILAQAGLLDGYNATTHWAYRSIIERHPTINFVDKRVVVDRQRISGGGITAGIDFTLILIEKLTSSAEAHRVQLLLEYDPQPPFNSGSPKKAPLIIKNQVEEIVNSIASDLLNYNY